MKTHLIAMSEQPADLLAIDLMGNEIYGEVNVDQLTSLPQKLMLSPQVSCTPEAVDAIHNADLIIIGPGSFLTSLMPLFLMNELTQALQASRAAIIYIGNLGKELNQPAANMQLTEKIAMIEKHIGQQKIDAVIASPVTDTSSLPDRIVLEKNWLTKISVTVMIEIYCARLLKTWHTKFINLNLLTYLLTRMPANGLLGTHPALEGVAAPHCG
ncbi:Putative gluconeogenesis factor [Arsenophonus endosymbiont of Bemisia tabaci Q2]|nr:Putative gluconeogenesis factor [Arsenophonus endosymbiont of Bemisia tabaci Q2]